MFTSDIPKQFKNKSFSLIIDGGFLYGLAEAYKDYPDAVEAVKAVKSFIKIHIFDKCPNWSGEYIMCLDSSKNFRKEINSEYKEKRKKERPKYLDAIQGAFVDKAAKVDGLEADDICGLYKSTFDKLKEVGEYEHDVIVVSSDKDLLQLGGYFIKPPHRGVDTVYAYVEKETADFLLHKQLLMGDSTDNIKGIESVGEVAAQNILECVDNLNKIASRAKYLNKFTYRDMVYLNYVRKYGLPKGEELYNLNLLMVKMLQVDYIPEAAKEYIPKQLPDMVKIKKFI